MATPPLPDYLIPTNDAQNARLAQLLGTTADKLCPGLKNQAIAKLLDKNNFFHQSAIDNLAKKAIEFVPDKFKDDKIFMYIKNRTVVTAQDVKDCWLKFAHGIQYGFEQGPSWNVPDRPNFIVKPTMHVMDIAEAWYNIDENYVAAGNALVLSQAMNRTAELLNTVEGTRVVKEFLWGEKKYSDGFAPVKIGLEEIRHAHQANDKALKQEFPQTANNEEILKMAAEEKKAFYEQYPIEVDAAKFVEQHYQAAVDRFRKTQKSLGFSDRVDESRSGGSMHSRGGKITDPRTKHSDKK